MPAPKEERPLKVCSTCCFWTPKYKGFCEQLQQGAGKFWICEGWSDAVEETDTLTPAAAMGKAAASHR